jgi:hypothetical protein
MTGQLPFLRTFGVPFCATEKPAVTEQLPLLLFLLFLRGRRMFTRPPASWGFLSLSSHTIHISSSSYSTLQHVQQLNRAGVHGHLRKKSKKRKKDNGGNFWCAKSP